MIPSPAQLNYADFPFFKDFSHRPSNFPVKSDDAFFPNLSLLINEKFLPFFSFQILRVIRNRWVRGECMERLLMPGCCKGQNQHSFGTKEPNRLQRQIISQGNDNCQLTGKGSSYTTLLSLTKCTLAKPGY